MITIIELGVVQIQRITDDGNWRTSLSPGEWDRANELLDADELAQVTAIWTPEVVTAWEEEMAANMPHVPSGPQLPTDAERFAALEDAVLKLMLGGLL